ncbi:MAG: glycogen debranching N-terminal domain-containing protein [Bacillota bacterium]
MKYQLIKNKNTFLISDFSGDLGNSEFDQNGLYWNDTRYLSRYRLMLNDIPPLVLKSENKDNVFNTALLTNGALNNLAEGKIFIKRKQAILDRVFYDNFTVKNYDRARRSISLEIEIGADFLDIFQVRGYYKKDLNRKKVEKSASGKQLRFDYYGLDAQRRSLIVKCSSDICCFHEKGIDIKLDLDSGQSVEFTIFLIAENSSYSELNSVIRNDFAEIEKTAAAEKEKWEKTVLQVESSCQKFDELISRSKIDLKTLSIDAGFGKIPAAGTPWYAVPFGRDSIITALQTLCFNPEFSRSVLKTLAHFQGRKVDPTKEEEPGKIFHELRTGELAALEKIPHTPYYGTADATPLFLILAGEYYRWTGDLNFIKSILKNLELALEWIDKYGDKDGDLFVEFKSSTEDYTVNQGWKDSVDSSVYPDGKLAEPPIALAEVQAYVYRAKILMADMFRDLNRKEESDKLHREAQQLKIKFNDKFWNKDKEIFVLALDKNKNQIDSLTTNPAHGYYTGIIDKKKGEMFLDKILNSDLNSGRGLRTLSKTNRAYNPISYHNGSIWPHDNSLIIEGLKKYGYRKEANQLISDIFEVAQNFEYYRLPELYCGFGTEEERTAVEYPTGCSPQAWAAGSVYLFLHSMLGIDADAKKGEVIIKPNLPDFLESIEIDNFKIADDILSFKVVKENGANCLKNLKSLSKIKIIN